MSPSPRSVAAIRVIAPQLHSPATGVGRRWCNPGLAWRLPGRPGISPGCRQPGQDTEGTGPSRPVTQPEILSGVKDSSNLHRPNLDLMTRIQTSTGEFRNPKVSCNLLGLNFYDPRPSAQNYPGERSLLPSLSPPATLIPLIPVLLWSLESLPTFPLTGIQVLL